MKERIIDRLAILLAVVFLIASVACVGSNTPTASPDPDVMVSPSVTASSVESPLPTEEPTPKFAYSYGIDYSIIPNAIKPKLTEADLEAYYAVVDAFARYETGISISSEGEIRNLPELLELCFPVFYADVADDALKINGSSVEWSYSVNENKHFKLIESFESTVLGKLNRVNDDNMADASTLARMLTLYKDMTIAMEYSYDSQSYYNGEIPFLAENKYMNHAYDALSSERGVCWCYARAYAFLLNHIGVEAFTTSCDGGIGHHEWTVFYYDESWFFADPTWDMYGGLSYFGMTSKNRESSNYKFSDMQYFAGGAYPLCDDFEISDSRFSELVNGTYGMFYDYEIDSVNNRIIIDYADYDDTSVIKKAYFDLETFELEY